MQRRLTLTVKRLDAARCACLQGLLIGLCLMAAGCASPSDKHFTAASRANVYVAPVAYAVDKVAVMPFKASTELIGSSCSDMFVTELLRMNLFDLVERSQMAQVLNEAELTLSGLSESRAAEVGAMLGADGVIIGTVDEYGTVALRGHPYPVVGMSVRLINCQSGKVVWSVDFAQRAKSKDTTLAQHGREVIHEIACGLYGQLKTQKRIPLQAAGASPPPSSTASAAVAALPTSVAGPPAAPAGFKVSDMQLREVTMAWPPPTCDVRQYRIERSASMEGPYEVLATVSAGRGEYRDRGSAARPLADATTYFYRLRAIDAQGEQSPPCAPVESMTAPPPDPPCNVRAGAPTPRAVHVEWDPAVSEGVEKYRVERAVKGETPSFVKVGETVRSTFDEGGTLASELRDSTVYLYRVTAVNRVGAIGTPSLAVEIETLPAPPAVTGVSAGAGEVRCVPLRWNVSEDVHVTGYVIDRAEAPGEEYVRVANLKGRSVASWLDGGRDPGNLEDEATYFYRVRAINGVLAESVEAQAVSATTRSVPPEPAELCAVLNAPRRVPLTWAVSSDEKVMGYRLERSAAKGNWKEIADRQGRDTTAYVDKGDKPRIGKSADVGRLEDGAEYRYRLRAYNTARAMSEWSPEVMACTKRIPATPTGVSATIQRPKSVRVTWQPNPEPDIAHYVVGVRDADASRLGNLARVAAGGPALEAEEAGLRDGQRRVYQVRAVDVDGLESEWSESAPGAAKAVPTAPRNLQCAAGPDGVVLSWSRGPEEDVVSYKVYSRKLLSWSLQGEAPREEFAIPPPALGRGLVVAITAVDADGLESERSDVVDVKPGSQP